MPGIRSRKAHIAKSAYDFLEYCHSLGAGGVQMGLDSLEADYLDRLRRRTAELGMYLEVIVSLPESDATADFERHLDAAQQAGAVCLRSACLNGRRYENFTSLDTVKKVLWRESAPANRAGGAGSREHRLPLGALRITRTGRRTKWWP